MTDVVTNDILMALAAMGFELEDCEAVLSSQRCLSVEDAVSRLLQKKNHAMPAENPVPVGPDSHVNVSSSERPSYSGTDMDIGVDGQPVTSRFACSDEQRKSKEAYQHKQCLDASRIAKRQRLENKMLKETIKKEIQSDKEKRHDLHPTLDTSTGASLAPVTSSTNPDQAETNNTCRIKIRIPNGPPVIRTFDVSASLRSVLDCALTANGTCLSHPELSLSSPRKVFVEDELAESLLTLGMAKTVSLVLTNNPPVVGCIPSSPLSPLCPDNDDNVSVPEEDLEQEEEDVIPAVASHNWGVSGHSLTEGNTSHDDAGTMPSASTSCDSDAHRQGDNGAHSVDADDARADQQQQQQQRNEPQLQQRRVFLLEDRAPVVQPQRDDQSAAARLAVERRAGYASQSAATHVERVAIHRDITSLQYLCADCIAHTLHSVGAGHLHGIGRLSRSSALAVVTALKKRKLLTNKTLNLFIACKLASLDLDCYPLTTNALLEAARFHVYITNLSLSSATFVTDVGLTAAVHGLQKLRALNISGCVKITDKVMYALSDLRHLEVLILDHTKVGNDGLGYFLNESKSDCLFELSCCGTPVSHDGLLAGRVFDKLKTLKLSATNVSDVAFVSSFPGLLRLSLSQTSVTDAVLITLRSARHLQCLDLSKTAVTNDGLEKIQDLQLSCLNLPSKHSVNNATISLIKGMPLSSLNLSSFVEVNDAGIELLQTITSLRSLSLEGLRLTDGCLPHINALINLEELDLSKTLVTDVGISSLKGLWRLKSLSLNTTKITSACAIDGSLNALRILNQLNLSGTDMDDSGLRYLSLPCLRMLNLDMTLCSALHVQCLTGCPNLTCIRANRCRLPPA